VLNTTTIGHGLGHAFSRLLAWGLGWPDVTTATPVETIERRQIYTLKSSSQSTWRVYTVE